MPDQTDLTCDYCGQPFIQPVPPANECSGRHPKPDKAWLIWYALEKTLDSRKNVLCIDRCDDDIQAEIRDEAAQVIREML